VHRLALVAGALIGLLPAGATVARAQAAGPGVSTLAVESAGAWRAWWRSDQAPARWRAADSSIVHGLAWRRVGVGVEWTSLRLAGDAPAWRTRLVVVRIDPRRVRIALDLGLTRDDMRPDWTIERAPRGALVACNAGQFVRTMPWGWVVQSGRERFRPGPGPLSMALAFGRDGATRWIPGDSLGAPPADVETAFQSYPVLLAGDGDLPAPLRTPGRGVSLTHRDARLAIGETREGILLVVMTRFDALGESAGSLPIGPTTPEMAAIMGALGAKVAMMLDGGISAQMVLRDAPSGRRMRWAGWRKVPLALVVSRRNAPGGIR
jgi:hypothetical protein